MNIDFGSLLNDVTSVLGDTGGSNATSLMQDPQGTLSEITQKLESLGIDTSIVNEALSQLNIGSLAMGVMSGNSDVVNQALSSVQDFLQSKGIDSSMIDQAMSIIKGYFAGK